MKYIRTKDRIFERMFPNDEQRISFDHKTIEPAYFTVDYEWVAKRDVIAQADTIEELCDYIIYNEYSENGYGKLVFTRVTPKEVKNQLKFVMLDGGGNIKLSILKDDDLICVAKMNDKGELELL